MTSLYDEAKLYEASSSYSTNEKRKRGLCLILLVLSMGGHAQTAPQEYVDLIRSRQNVDTLGTELLGDRMDYDTGQVTFTATDASLPGNNALKVAVGRRYDVQANPSGTIVERAFGDWDIDLPRIEGIVATDIGWTVSGANPNQRCSQFESAPPSTVSNESIQFPGQTILTPIPSDQYSTGYSLNIPGLGTRELLQRAPGNTQYPENGNFYTYPIVTNDWWMREFNSEAQHG